MKFVVDRIEEEIIVLENIENKTLINIDKKQLNFAVNEGNVLIKKNEQFFLDEETEKTRRKKIQEKFAKLKN